MAAAGQDARIGTLIEMLGKTLAPVQAAISPDGTTVAWTVWVAPRVQQIHLTNVVNPDAAKDRMVGPTGASCGNSGPVWSPDGAWLAFISDCAAKGAQPGQQVFLWSKKTGRRDS